METPILRDLCELIVDCEHKTAPVETEGYPSIRTPNVGRGRLILDNVNRVSEATYNAWTKRAVPREGDLVLAREAPVGNVAIVTKGLKVCLGQRTVLIRPNRLSVEPSYLLYLLLSSEIQAKFQSLTAGATVPHLNMADIRSMELPQLPSREEQVKISSVLSNYDDLVENNHRRVSLLDEMTRTIYREWFELFRFRGSETGRMIESELGPIPFGWKVFRAGDAFATILGGTPSRDNPDFWINGTIPWVNSGKVNELRITDASELITPLGLEHSSTKMMPRRSTVLAITGATLGQVSMLEIEACANQSVVGIFDPSGLYSEWIYLTFCAKIPALAQHASGGAQQHINKEIINDLKIVVPSRDVIQDFNFLVRPMFDLIANLLRKTAALRSSRELLLPKLIENGVELFGKENEVSNV